MDSCQGRVVSFIVTWSFPIMSSSCNSLLTTTVTVDRTSISTIVVLSKCILFDRWIVGHVDSPIIHRTLISSPI